MQEKADGMWYGKKMYLKEMKQLVNDYIGRRLGGTTSYNGNSIVTLETSHKYRFWQYFILNNRVA